MRPAKRTSGRKPETKSQRQARLLAYQAQEQAKTAAWRERYAADPRDTYHES